MAQCPVLLRLQKKTSRNTSPKAALRNKRLQTSGSTFDKSSCGLLQRKVLKSVYYCVSYNNNKIKKATLHTQTAIRAGTIFLVTQHYEFNYICKMITVKK